MHVCRCICMGTYCACADKKKIHTSLFYWSLAGGIFFYTAPLFSCAVFCTVSWRCDKEWWPTREKGNWEIGDRGSYFGFTCNEIETCYLIKLQLSKPKVTWLQNWRKFYLWDKKRWSGPRGNRIGTILLLLLLPTSPFPEKGNRNLNFLFFLLCGGETEKRKGGKKVSSLPLIERKAALGHRRKRRKGGNFSLVSSSRLFLFLHHLSQKGKKKKWKAKKSSSRFFRELNVFDMSAVAPPSSLLFGWIEKKHLSQHFGRGEKEFVDRRFPNVRRRKSRGFFFVVFFP